MWRKNYTRTDAGSNAEDMLQARLNKARLDGTLKVGYVTHQEIMLTITDITVPGANLHVFIDGPRHLKPAQQKLDALIDEVLGLRKQNVIRHPYKPPMSNREADALFEKILEAVK